MKAFCGFLFLLFIVVSVSSNRSFTRLPWRIFYRSHNGIKDTYIIDDNGHFSFNSTVVWCSQLGGKLPVILDQSDYDFLMEEVILVSSPGGSFKSWMGRKASSDSVCSSEWMDNTVVKYPFEEMEKENCSSCSSYNCCAMYIMNDRDNFGKIGHQSCQSTARRVCIISEPIAL